MKDSQEECCCKSCYRTENFCTKIPALILNPGFSFVDISSDTLNTFELAGCDMSWMGPFASSHSFDTEGCSNDDMSCRPTSDPIWATVSGILIFAPGWLFALYLWLGSGL